MSVRAVFFGTPAIAVPILDAVAKATEVALVVTAPDRPKGRGLELTPSSVKVRAQQMGLQVFQPRTLRDPRVSHELAGADADVFVVAAYGLILPEDILAIPKRGCVNVHYSLLPKLRGAAPVQWAIIEGLRTTGVTLMQMDAGMDTGPLLASAEEPIREEDDAGTLAVRLAELGARLCLEMLPLIVAGDLPPIPQDDSMASYAPKLSPADARIDWSLGSAAILARIRAFSPRPGAWSMLNGKRVKVWRAAIHDGSVDGAPGSVSLDGEALLAQARDGRVRLLEVQPEGRSRMDGAAFARGYRPRTGDQLT